MGPSNPVCRDFFEIWLIIVDAKKEMLFKAVDTRGEFLLAVAIEAIVSLDFP